ncbi:cobalamin B12-binding domain-containing protein [Magnetospirillum sp. ME-1]|uniref:cobalamin B12-binding domain-containing protein n=1 Tax=Magnetospirillum sp. ME-1 TaxID=1639348 RepID=UPI00143D0D7C|nr:cobalamin-dependent protein [Magnetospirillum sp. ME-1]
MNNPAIIGNRRAEIAADAMGIMKAGGLSADADELRAMLLYLSEALCHASPALFLHYVGWRKSLLAGQGLPETEIDAALAAVSLALPKDLENGSAQAARDLIASAREQLRFMPSEPPGHLTQIGPAADLARQYLDALLGCRRHAAAALILNAVEDGMPVKTVYLDVFQPVLREVGRLWQMNRVSVAQEHYITAVTQGIMSQLYPRIFGAEAKNRSMVACCVSGELHEIGVRMVADCFEMSGWDSHYLGANAPVGETLDMAQSVNAELIAVSATLTSHVGLVANLITSARQRFGTKVSILVGGYPFNIDETLWSRLGADGTAQNADDAVRLAERGGW